MSNDLTKQEIRTFLKGLAALSEKTGVVIGGCGCCGSPALSRVDAEWHKVSRPVQYGSDDYTDVTAKPLPAPDGGYTPHRPDEVTSEQPDTEEIEDQ